MRPTRYIVAGWACALSAVAAGTMAMPAIAQKASNQRVGTILTQTAMDFRRLPEENYSSVAQSPAVVRLTELYGPDAQFETDLNKFEFDLNAIVSDRQGDIRQAKAELAQQRCLAEAIYYEARSETRSGQIAVAQVVQNRVRSKHYPDTICGVVYQGAERRTGCQFSFTCDGSTEREPKGASWRMSKAVAKMVVTQPPRNLVNRSTHYHTTEVNPVWSGTLEKTRTVGSHIFYRFPWRERRTPTATVSVAPPS